MKGAEVFALQQLREYLVSSKMCVASRGNASRERKIGEIRENAIKMCSHPVLVFERKRCLYGPILRHLWRDTRLTPSCSRHARHFPSQPCTTLNYVSSWFARCGFCEGAYRGRRRGKGIVLGQSCRQTSGCSPSEIEKTQYTSLFCI